MNETNYKNYKKPLKTQCIVQIAASAVAFFALIFIFFLPIFHIDMSKIPPDIKTSLPKIENLAEDIFKDLGDSTDIDDVLGAFNKSMSVDFSFYDEIYATFNPATSTDEAGLLLSFSMLQIFGGVILLAAAGISLFTIGKNLTGIISSDDYAIKAYDSIKRREKKSKYAWMFSPTYLFICGVAYEIFCIILMRYVNRITDLKIATSYFALVTGLSGVAFIPIFFTLIATGGFIAAKILKSRITAEVLKEEYGEKQTSNDISDVFDE